MKYVIRLAMLALVVACTCSSGSAQITNFTVNGDTASGQTLTTGSVVNWQYNLPAGSTALCQLWYDVNQNGLIDTAVDFNYFTFTQTDGDTNGNNGPADQDGLVNGHILFDQAIGLAPGKYVFKVSQNSSVVIRTFTVAALASPAHTVSGTVTPPAGKSAQYILVDLKQQNHHDNNKFWDVVTDIHGNFMVGMDADTSGNPWELTLGQNGTPPFAPAILNPGQYYITISNPTYTGYNFTFVAAAAQVTGYLKDENGNVLGNSYVTLNRNDQNNLNYDGNLNQETGFFQIGIAAGDLDGASWTLSQGYNGNMNGQQNMSGAMLASSNLGVLAQGDSVFRNLISYFTNTTISGQVRSNGSPVNFPLNLFASTQGDSGYSFGIVDTTNGNFSIPVSNKIASYRLYVSNPPPGIAGEVDNVHPGQSGVILNLSQGNSVSINFFVNTNWNLVSVPVQTNDMQKTTLFPSAVSNAFAYLPGAGYQLRETLATGTGYWLKFPGPQDIDLTGGGTSPDTIAVTAGWNLIGGVSTTTTDSNITSIPGDMQIQPPFQYGPSGYFKSDTLWSGQGYWLKTNESGLIVLGNHPGKSGLKNRVHIVPSSELVKPEIRSH